MDGAEQLQWFQSRWHKPQKVVYMDAIYSETIVSSWAMRSGHWLTYDPMFVSGRNMETTPSGSHGETVCRRSSRTNVENIAGAPQFRGGSRALTRVAYSLLVVGRHLFLCNSKKDQRFSETRGWIGQWLS